MSSPSCTTSPEDILRRKIREGGVIPTAIGRFGMALIPCPACYLTLRVFPKQYGAHVRHNCPKCRKTFFLDKRARGYIYKGRRIGTVEFELGC